MENAKRFCVSMAFLLSGFSAHAVIVDVPIDDESAAKTKLVSSTPSEETEALIRSRVSNTNPFPFWDHVGMVGMGTGIYLGDGHVLTSAHVGCYPFRLTDGSYYKPIYKSWTVLHDGAGNRSDLAIFRVNFSANSPLARMDSLPISTAAPKANDAMILLGSGLSQTSEPSTLRSNGKVLAVLGYRIQAKRAMTWGFNTISELPGEPVKYGKFTTHCFLTRFDTGALEAQAAAGDSGGASFVFNPVLARWELAGCIIGVTQKDTYIPFGSRTFLADLSSYRNQLPFKEDIVPEPSLDETSESESVDVVSKELPPHLTDPAFEVSPAVISVKIPD